MTDLIKYHYQHYLEKVKLKETDMSPIQSVEMKRAFTAGMSEMFVAMISGLGLGVTLDDYRKELTDFWTKETEKFNNREKP